MVNPTDIPEPDDHPSDLSISGFHPSLIDANPASGTQRLATSAIRRAVPPASPTWPWVACAIGVLLVAGALTRSAYRRASDAIVSARWSALTAPEPGYLIRYLAPTGTRFQVGTPLAETDPDREPVDLEALRQALGHELSERERLTRRLETVETALVRREDGNDYALILQEDLKAELQEASPGDPRKDVLLGWLRALDSGKIPRSRDAHQADLTDEAGFLAMRIAGIDAAIAVARLRLASGAHPPAEEKSTVMRASISGTLIEKSAMVGTRVQREQRIMGVTSDATTMLVAWFPDHTRIAPGSRCWLRLAAGGPVTTGWTEELKDPGSIYPSPPPAIGRTVVGIRLAEPSLLAPRLGEQVRVIIDDGAGSASSLLRWLAVKLWL